MGTRGPPQAPRRRLTALRRRHAAGIGAISAVLGGYGRFGCHSVEAGRAGGYAWLPDVWRRCRCPRRGLVASLMVSFGGFADAEWKSIFQYSPASKSDHLLRRCVWLPTIRHSIWTTARRRSGLPGIC